ncbi:hypothetical protein [Burkholderia cepacia]|uniref:hypothetical protein n=1 Tax=Burkholderia cepacia TaxID=292 RepID=UPI000B2A8ED4
MPDVALSLRIVKIMSTTVGETGADYLAVNVGLGRIVTRLAMALWMQLRTHCEVPRICQPTVVLVNIVGTRIADLLIVEVNVSLHASATINAARSRRSSSCGIALNARCRSTRSSCRDASGSMSGRYGSATSAVQRTPRLNVSRRSSRDRSCATG